jgi:hypothetical protein
LRQLRVVAFVARGLNRDEASWLAERGGDPLVERTKGELCKTQLFRSREEELVGAIADTRTALRLRGGRDGGRARGHRPAHLCSA